jgi:hypothetical protein
VVIPSHSTDKVICRASAGAWMARQLSYEVIDAKPQYFDFCKGYGDTWDIPLSLTDEERENETYVPIYNFLYPLGDGFTVPKDFRRRLVSTTIVNRSDLHFLALTCCGMDCSWEICESYMNLGYHPPVHFTLPAMAGRAESARDKRIIAACRRSLEAMIARCERAKEHLQRL